MLVFTAQANAQLYANSAYITAQQPALLFLQPDSASAVSTNSVRLALSADCCVGLISNHWSEEIYSTSYSVPPLHLEDVYIMYRPDVPPMPALVDSSVIVPPVTAGALGAAAFAPATAVRMLTGLSIATAALDLTAMTSRYQHAAAHLLIVVNAC
jgi:hypothetical protein